MNDGLNFDYEFDGKKYALLQEPYFATGINYISQGGVDYPQFTASCVDEAGKEHHMYWDVLDCWLTEDGEYNGECDTDEGMCDWDNPSSVEEI